MRCVECSECPGAGPGATRGRGRVDERARVRSGDDVPRSASGNRLRNNWRVTSYIHHHMLASSRNFAHCEKLSEFQRYVSSTFRPSSNNEERSEI